MSNTSIFIRKATIKDISKLTDLHCKSFKVEDHIPMVLGKNYVEATYKWQVNSEKSFVFVAETNDKIIGFLAVCDGAYTKAMFMACLPEFISGLLKNPKLILEKSLWKRLFRRSKISKKLETVVNSTGFAQITIGAVDGDFRGTGVFGELINATKEYSKKRGSKAIRVGIYKKNQSSRKAFTKAGWTEIPQLQTSETVFYAKFFDTNMAKVFETQIH